MKKKILLEANIDKEVVNIALRYPDEKYDVKSWRKNLKTGEIYPIQIESKKNLSKPFLF